MTFSASFQPGSTPLVASATPVVRAFVVVAIQAAAAQVAAAAVAVLT